MYQREREVCFGQIEADTAEQSWGMESLSGKVFMALLPTERSDCGKLEVV